MLTLIARLSAVFCFAALAAGSFVMADNSSSTKQSTNQGAKPQNEAALRARAEKLHRAPIVIDTHNDITSPLVDDGFDLGSSGIEADGKLKTHTDIKRMREGG